MTETPELPRLIHVAHICGDVREIPRGYLIVAVDFTTTRMLGLCREDVPDAEVLDFFSPVLPRPDFGLCAVRLYAREISRTIPYVGHELIGRAPGWATLAATLLSDDEAGEIENLEDAVVEAERAVKITSYNPMDFVPAYASELYERARKALAAAPLDPNAHRAFDKAKRAYTAVLNAQRSPSRHYGLTQASFARSQSSDTEFVYQLPGGAEVRVPLAPDVDRNGLIHDFGSEDD